MKEYLIIHDYQHGGFAFRVMADSKEQILSVIGNDFEVWADFRTDKCLIARFKAAKNKSIWEQIPLKTLSDLNAVFGQN